MKITEATFVKSSADYTQCPQSQFPELAFIGRSNVGKSSIINFLTGQKNLAKTSGTPGKTQLINHFLVNNAWYLVDLPGYGYAKISRSVSSSWEKMIRDFLLNRPTLVNTFILIDSRIEPQASDLELINWFGENRLPFIIVFTKSDKLSKLRLKTNLINYQECLSGKWEELPVSVVTSVKTGIGKDTMLEIINNLIDGY